MLYLPDLSYERERIALEMAPIQSVEIEDILPEVEPPAWTQAQIESVVSWFKQKYRDSSTPFPDVPFPDADVYTLSGATGIHRVLWEGNDSLHAMTVFVDVGPTSYRYVFRFTLSPPVEPYEGGRCADWTAALERSKLTQYFICRYDNSTGTSETLGLQSRTDEMHGQPNPRIEPDAAGDSGGREE